MQSWKYLVAIASLIALTGCSVSSSTDRIPDDPSSGEGSLNVPWDEPDTADVTNDPTDDADPEGTTAPETTVPGKKDDPLAITPAGAELPDGTVGHDYEQIKIRADGGSGSYTMTVDGELPPGLKAKCGAHECDGAEGVSTVKILGTPSKAGTFDFSITIEDRENAGTSLKQEFSIDIASGAGDLVGNINLTMPGVIAKPIDFAEMTIVTVTPPEDRSISISDISTQEGKEGELPYATSIDVKVVGGSPAYTWSDPIVFGEASIEPDADDSSKATLKVTRVFPTLGEKQTVHAFIRLIVSDAHGNHASAQIDIAISFPRGTIEDMEVVGCNGNTCSSMGVNATFFDRHDDIIAQWTIGLEGSGELQYTPEFPIDTALSKIDRIRITGCSGALEPEDTVFALGCFMSPSLEYTSVTFRSKYWEAVYPKYLKQAWEDSSITIFYLEDVMQDMKGYEEGKPQAIWRPRTDNLPRPPVVPVQDGPIRKSTGQSAPKPAEGESCFLSDEMRSQGAVCVEDEVGLAEGCAMLPEEIDEGFRCIEGCVFAPEEITPNIEQFIAEDKASGKATICVGL